VLWTTGAIEKKRRLGGITKEAVDLDASCDCDDNKTIGNYLLWQS
jgi:hypothetical protein